LWTEQFNHVNHIGLTGHYLDENSNIARVTLAYDPFESQSTGEEIAHSLQVILDDWVIKKEDVVCLVTDGAGNMRLGTEILLGKSKHFICYAHRLNNAAQSAMKALPECDGLLRKVKMIVQFANQSNNFSDLLRNSQAGDDLEGRKPLKLIQSVETRWDSIYLMLERFIKLYDYVTLAIIKHPEDPKFLVMKRTNL